MHIKHELPSSGLPVWLLQTGPCRFHDGGNPRKHVKSTICHVPPAENLVSFFDKARSIPILSEGIVNQCQLPILQAIHIFYFLIPLKVFQRIPCEVITVNTLYFQNMMPFWYTLFSCRQVCFCDRSFSYYNNRSFTCQYLEFDEQIYGNIIFFEITYYRR